MYVRRPSSIEVLLVHPGGPFWRKRDEGAWSIPKGEPNEGEDLLAAALREFHEEVGFAAKGDLIALGWVQQKGGKVVYAWALEAAPDQTISLTSNTFELEWPPRSGTVQTFPEIDRAEFFPLAEAEKKINQSQQVFLERLRQKLGS
ncbi:MAG TPA: NUDIX domain-containing protein [Terrimicrobiaceae bacterium]|nr:NUDIX domain-containing protein [Terrimicrobiaceae bacterium]